MAAVLFAPRIGAQPRPQRIGFLNGGMSPDESIQRHLIRPFREGLRALGRVEGRDHVIEFRFAEGRADRLAPLADELLRWQPDLLVSTANAPTRALQQATTTVPILALAVDDPVELGFAKTFARPGGNITGISSWGAELLAKRLELIKALLPGAQRVGVLGNTASAKQEPLERALRRFGEPLGLQTQVALATTPEQFGDAFEAFRRGRAEAVMVLADPMIFMHKGRIAELCNQYRLPSVWGGRDYLHGGGLASYQADFIEVFSRGAVLADQILKGAKPAEMPFERANKLVLVINLKAARALGITVPRPLLLAADEVLE
ncbi:ABC transporter substrate-binding protein [Aquabacterium humicola]|uniref:ABC transporter substrate-binding protein n=1 Tax=Aquabacterium humicola TaxID=3237377 RepID=UPI002543ED17|nr:ABC transporter substrate-binding protein [Rubrivivax pictus]